MFDTATSSSHGAVEDLDGRLIDASEIATYSLSHEESATDFCILDTHLIAAPAKKYMTPVTLRLVTLHPA